MKSFYYIAFCLLLISCDTDEQTRPEKTDFEVRAEKTIQIDSLNKLNSLELAAKYNAITEWVKDGAYTYHLQALLQNEKRPILFVGRISDIVKEGDIYVLNVSSQKFNPSITRYLAKINVDTLTFKKLELSFENKTRSFNTYCFIIDVTDIKMGFPKLSSVTDDDGIRLSYDYQLTLTYFTSNLVDFYKYNEQ